MSIKISIEAELDQENCTVRLEGTEERPLTSEDFRTLGFTMLDLKKSVQAIYGRSPNDLYFDLPGGEHKLYEHPDWHWNPVTLLFKPKSWRIVDFNSELNGNVNSLFDNSKGKGTNSFELNLHEEKSTTVENSSFNSNSISISQSISYGVEFKGVGNIGGETQISYTSEWGSSHTQSENVTVGKSITATIEVPPGTIQKAILQVYKNQLVVEVDYEVFIRGVFACNYKNKMNGHHFYPFLATTVLKNLGIPGVINITEQITINYWMDGFIKVVDPTTNKELFKVAPGGKSM